MQLGHKSFDLFPIFSSDKLLVITGYPTEWGVHSEVIDIGNPDMICEELQPRGFQRGCTGGVILKQALVCGCRVDNAYDSNSEFSNTCWVEGHDEEDVLYMSYQRGFSSGVVINNKVSS